MNNISKKDINFLYQKLNVNNDEKSENTVYNFDEYIDIWNFNNDDTFFVESTNYIK